MSVVGKFIGYIECDSCGKFVHISNPDDIYIWAHPDDPRPLAQATCPCGSKVTSRIDRDHMINFKKRGCKIRDYSERFEPLTEEAIDDWDFEKDFASTFGELSSN